MFTRIKSFFNRSTLNEKALMELGSVMTTAIVVGVLLSGAAATMLYLYNLRAVEDENQTNQASRMNIEMRFKESLRDGIVTESSPSAVTTQYVLGLEEEGQPVCIESTYNVEPLTEDLSTLTETRTTYYSADCSGEGHTTAPLTMKFTGKGVFSVYQSANRELQFSGGEATFKNNHDGFTEADMKAMGDEADRLQRVNEDLRPLRINFQSKEHTWEARDVNHRIA